MTAIITELNGKDFYSYSISCCITRRCYNSSQKHATFLQVTCIFTFTWSCGLY